MADLRITCPECGLSKDVAAERVPAAAVQVTCPGCQHRFPLPAVQRATAASAPAPSADETAAPPPAAPFPEAPLQNLPLRRAGSRAKTLLLCFVLLVIMFVALRLWADGKKRSVPFPNFIAASPQGVAVSWGDELLLLDHSGKVTGRQSLPEGTVLTQLLYVDGELWHADHATNSIKRLRDGTWETVVRGAGRFRGAFKFAVDLNSREIFVADAANHTIHQFMTDGSYVGSFGREGKLPGELKFPNSILFDRDGNLIVANTNCFRIDLFSRRGEFLRTIAHVAPVSEYKYPTLLARVGDRFVFLHTVDLCQALVMLYGADGEAIGQFSTPRRLEEAGDLTAWDGKVLVTDHKSRRVLSFSAADRSYLGPLSAELEARGKEAGRLEARYAALSSYFLRLLVLCCLPVFYLYYQTRQNEERRLETVDCGSILPGAAILGLATDRKKMALAVLVVIVTVLMALLCIPYLKDHESLKALLMLSTTVFTLVAVRLAMESSFSNPSRGEQVEKLVRAAASSLPHLLAVGEQVEACTALQRNAYLRRPSLILLTTRRLLMVDFAALRPIGFCQIGYGDIAETRLEPAKFGIRCLNRVLKTEMFRLRLTLRPPGAAAPLSLTGVGRQIPERLQRLLDEKRSDGLALGYAVLCPRCFRPLGPEGCPHCSQARKPDWKPLLLSLLYPGLGQFYNREIMKGSVLSIFFTIDILTLTRPMTQIMNHSAETSKAVGIQIVYYLFMMGVLYIGALADADLVGRQGRRLFSKGIFKWKVRMR